MQTLWSYLGAQEVGPSCLPQVPEAEATEVKKLSNSKKVVAKSSSLCLGCGQPLPETRLVTCSPQCDLVLVGIKSKIGEPLR